MLTLTEKQKVKTIDLLDFFCSLLANNRIGRCVYIVNREVGLKKPENIHIYEARIREFRLFFSEVSK